MYSTIHFTNSCQEFPVSPLWVCSLSFSFYIYFYLRGFAAQHSVAAQPRGVLVALVGPVESCSLVRYVQYL